MPYDEAPAEAAPAPEPPASEAPAEEAPAPESPASEAPAEEAPDGAPEEEPAAEESLPKEPTEDSSQSKIDIVTPESANTVYAQELLKYAGDHDIKLYDGTSITTEVFYPHDVVNYLGELFSNGEIEGIGNSQGQLAIVLDSQNTAIIAGLTSTDLDGVKYFVFENVLVD